MYLFNSYRYSSADYFSFFFLFETRVLIVKYKCIITIVTFVITTSQHTAPFMIISRDVEMIRINYNDKSIYYYYSYKVLLYYYVL